MKRQTPNWITGRATRYQRRRLSVPHLEIATDKADALRIGAARWAGPLAEAFRASARGDTAALDFLRSPFTRYAPADWIAATFARSTSMDPRTLAPVYGPDLRLLVKRAFEEPRSLPVEPVPSGTISERVNAPSTATNPTLGVCDGIAVSDDAAGVTRSLSPMQYWSLALPHRLLALGPLLDLSTQEIEPIHRAKIEERLLLLYRHRYHAVPLPLDLLRLIRTTASDTPEEMLPHWLDDARVRSMAAETVEEAIALRSVLRLEALRRGASNDWKPRTVAVAELMTDVITMCRAVREDVEMAASRADDHGGSVTLALHAMDESAETAFEAILPALMRPAFHEVDLQESERNTIVVFALSRPAPRSIGLLLGESATPATTPPHQSTHRPLRQVSERAGPDATNGSTRDESAAESYRRLKAGLEEHIIGNPELCRRLALVGTGHLHGVTHQRVLLVGPSGSGKTLAGRALACVLDRPHLRVDMSDVTGTGWRGADIPILLDDLSKRSKSGLDGAVLHLDEVDKTAVSGLRVDGNSREAKYNVQTSLLGVLDGQVVTSEFGGEQMETSRLLVIGSGAFGGRFVAEPPTTEELVRWGWMPELAARWGERLCLSPPSRAEAIELLRSSERSVGKRLGSLAAALGIQIEVPEAVVAYVADLWLRSRSDYRSAAEWLLAAARRRMIEAIEQGSTPVIVLAPDDIDVPVRYGDSRDPRR